MTRPSVDPEIGEPPALRITRLALRTAGSGTTHEIARVAEERFGLQLSERQAAHYLGVLREQGAASRTDEPCTVCHGRGTKPTWNALP